jgi:hypothetical protein
MTSATGSETVSLLRKGSFFSSASGNVSQVNAKNAG